MLRIPALLRALLCLMLVFDGSGWAFAAPGPHHGSAAVAERHGDHTPAAGAPCHGQASTEAPADRGPEEAFGHEGDHIPDPGSAASDDCCESGACGCACAMHSPAVSAASPADARVHRLPAAMRLPTGHASRNPHPPNPPPIG